jgi:PhnB protein
VGVERARPGPARPRHHHRSMTRVRENAMKMNPYLFFEGQCEEAFGFYEKCTGGKIAMLMRMGDGPTAAQVPPESHNRIMHVRLEFDGGVLMGSDVPAEHFKQPQGFALSLNVTSVAEAERLFAALAEGGQVNMPLEKTFWAERFAMLVDRFGTHWMINCELAA